MTRIVAPGGYGVVSKRIMTDPDVSIQAKGLYALLATYAAYRTRETRVSRQRLARDLGCTERAVSNYMAELLGKGLLIRRARGQGHTHQTRLNDFVVVESDEAEVNDSSLKDGNVRSPRTRVL